MASIKHNLDIVRKLKSSYQKSAVIFTILSIIAFSVFMTFMSYNANVKTYKEESLKVINNFIDQELNFKCLKSILSLLTGLIFL